MPYTKQVHVERSVKISDKRIFEEEVYRGLAFYGDHDKPIEHMVLTMEKGDTDDILVYFRILQQKILRNVKWGWKRNIQFIGVVMKEPHYHAHIFVKKPFVDRNVLIRLWSLTYKEGSHIETRFLYKDKTVRSHMKKIVTYVMNNPDEHQSEDYFYFKSVNWGKRS